MKYLHTSDYVSLHDFVLYCLIPNNVAASIFFLANTKSVWKKRGSDFGPRAQQKEQSTWGKAFLVI